MQLVLIDLIFFFFSLFRGRAGPIRPLVPRGAPGRGAISRGASVSRSVAPTSRGTPSGRARAGSIQRISLPPPAPEAYDDYVSR